MYAFVFRLLTHGVHNAIIDILKGKQYRRSNFMKKRTKLRDRKLPTYTRGEEIFNMTSHIVGGGIAVVVLVTCIAELLNSRV